MQKLSRNKLTLFKWVIGFFVVLAVLAFTYNTLFPLFYKIKEPFFLMPINPTEGPVATEDLLIRNDDYGDGDFGAKRRGGRLHKGIDIKAKLKTPVYASKSGWASFVCVPQGYGNLVIIDHPGGWQTRYGHLYSSEITKPKWVSRGELIGSVGKTGNAKVGGMLSHLHFEIRKNDEPVDPAVELLRNGGNT